MKRYIIIIGVFFVALSAMAAASIDTTMQRYQQMLVQLATERDSLLANPSTRTRPDAYSLRLVAPIAVYKSALMQQFSAQTVDVGTDKMLIRNQMINDALAHIYVQSPQLVLQTQAQLDKAGTLRSGMDSTMKSDIRLIDKVVVADLATDL